LTTWMPKRRARYSRARSWMCAVDYPPAREHHRARLLRIEDARQQLAKKSSASAPTLVTQGNLPAR
jgi:hypothetical protein